MHFTTIVSVLAAVVAPVLGVVVTSTWTVSYYETVTCPLLVDTPSPTVTAASVTETLSLPYTTTTTFDVAEFSLSGIPPFTLPTPPTTMNPSSTYTTTVVYYPCTATETTSTYLIDTPTTVYSGTTTLTEWEATATLTSVTATYTYYD